MEVLKKDFLFTKFLPSILILQLSLTSLSFAHASISEDLSQIQSTLNSLNLEVSRVGASLDELRRNSGPRTPHDVFHRALLAFRSNRFEFSALGFEDFLVLFPQHQLAGSARFYLAESYFRRGVWSQAIENYEALLRIHSENKHAPLAREHLQLAREQLSQKIAGKPWVSEPLNYSRVNWSDGVLASSPGLPPQIENLLQVIGQSAEENHLGAADAQNGSRKENPEPAPKPFQAQVDPSSITQPQAQAPLEVPVKNPPSEFGACEAFDWNTPIADTMVVAVTKEGRASDSHWQRAEALGHIPTLLRSVGDEQESEVGASPIPLISMNTAKMLSALSGASLQSDAGIVFGKISDGYSVRLSGRSERPVFLNAQAQAVSSQETSGERYFAFLNVEPGAHLLYFVGTDGAEKGAVGITTLEGVATYADLSRVKVVRVGGRVFDGSNSRVKALAGVDIRVLGSPATRAQSDPTGSFFIENVLVVDNFPVYFETDYAKGFTHRYQVMPSKLAQVDLFRMSDRMIQSWMAQLAGSISPESGVIVAAVPNLVSEWGIQAKLNVNITSLAANASLKPEVYTLSSEGSLEVDQPLSDSDFRFFSVQLPAGPLQVKINDLSGHLAWSQLLMVSPAVINVIGPL